MGFYAMGDIEKYIPEDIRHVIFGDTFPTCCADVRANYCKNLMFARI